MHFTAGEKAAPKEAVDYVKAKGVACLKVMMPLQSICIAHAVSAWCNTIGFGNQVYV